MRILIPAVLAMLCGACKAPPLGPADYSTPSATLLTFQNAFQNDRADREYECFSQEFKKNHSSLSLSSYYETRQMLLEDQPVAAYIFSLNDLSDNIIEEIISPKGDRATLVLSVYGEEVFIEFIRETLFQIEFDEARAVGDFLPKPLHDLIRFNEEEHEFYLTLFLSPRIRDNLRSIRKIMVEKNWKFLRFSFLDEETNISN